MLIICEISEQKNLKELNLYRPGTYSKKQATECTPCDAGTFNGDFGTAACPLCPTGSIFTLTLNYDLSLELEIMKSKLF